MCVENATRAEIDDSVMTLDNNQIHAHTVQW